VGVLLEMMSSCISSSQPYPSVVSVSYWSSWRVVTLHCVAQGAAAAGVCGAAPVPVTGLCVADLNTINKFWEHIRTGAKREKHSACAFGKVEAFSAD